jgi:hypothetical protein
MALGDFKRALSLLIEGSALVRETEEISRIRSGLEQEIVK